MIEAITLPNGINAFRVAGGMIFARLAAAERFAKALAAKIARVAEARRGTLAKRVARLVEKARKLIAVIEARGLAKAGRIAAVEGVYSNKFIAAQSRTAARVGRVNFRVWKLNKLVAA